MFWRDNVINEIVNYEIYQLIRNAFDLSLQSSQSSNREKCSFEVQNWSYPNAKIWLSPRLVEGKHFKGGTFSLYHSYRLSLMPSE